MGKVNSDIFMPAELSIERKASSASCRNVKSLAGRLLWVHILSL